RAVASRPRHARQANPRPGHLQPVRPPPGQPLLPPQLLAGDIPLAFQLLLALFRRFLDLPAARSGEQPRRAVADSLHRRSLLGGGWLRHLCAFLEAFPLGPLALPSVCFPSCPLLLLP